MNLDRFSQAMPWENAKPEPSDECCPWCGRRMLEAKYPETEVEYAGQSWFMGGGTDVYCPHCG